MERHRRTELVMYTSCTGSAFICGCV